MLSVQFIEMAITARNVYHNLVKNKTKVQNLDQTIMLQGIFSIPALLICIFLFLKFRHAFSTHTSRNIIRISYIMLAENLLISLVRFTVCVKLFFVEKTAK